MSLNEMHELLGRSDAANRLRRLADQMDAGIIEQQSISAEVPDQVHFEIDIDPDEIEFTLKWDRMVEPSRPQNSL
ncbi:MAG: amphi-Trp domain-containing protein [Henriciella sp.]|nr:amphi-Trp domain-containing protein [Henriciella sp.]